MIPIKLTLEGGYSYQKKQTIDFTLLTQAKLFGVFGAVGSGKSTIIESIVFALYGETDRLKKSGDDRAYNMMNLKSDNMLIDFECFTGKQGKERYRFVYQARRNSKNFENISKNERTVYQLKGEEWEPVTGKSVEEIIGMDYKNFNRTIIIPQGKFKDFISLGPTDRARMLKELFGLEQYELYRPTKELYDDVKVKIDTKQGLLQSYDDVNEEFIQSLKASEKELLEKKKEEQIVLKKMQQDFEQLKQLQQAVAQLNDFSKQKEKLELDIPAFESRKKQLDLYKLAFAHFSDKLQLSTQLSNQVKELELKIKEKQISLTETLNSKAEVEKLEAAIQQKVGSLKEAERNIEDLTALIDVIKIDQELSIEQQTFISIQKQLQDKINEEELTKTKNKQLQDQLENLKENKVDIAKLKDVEKWFENCNALKEDVEKYKSSIDDKQSQLAYLQRQKDELYKQYELFDGMGEVPSFESCIKDSDTTFEEVERDYLLIQQKILKLKAKQEIIEVSSNLKSGEACPLCGSEEHPNPCSPADYEQELKFLESKKLVVDEKMKALRNMKDQLSKYYIEYQSVSGIVTEQKKVEENVITKLQQHYSLFQWKEYDPNDSEKLRTDLKQFDEQQKLIEEVDVKLKKGLQHFDAIRVTEDQLKEKIKHVEIEIKGKEEKVKTILSALHNKDLVKLRSKTLVMVQESLNKGRQFLTQLEQIDLKKKELNEAVTKIETFIQANEQQLKDLIKQQEEHNRQLEVALKEHQFESIEAVIDILKTSLDVINEEKELEAFYKLLDQVNNSIELLSKQLKGVEWSDDDFVAKQSQLQVKEQSFSVLEQELGGVQTKITNSKSRLQEKEEIVKELEALMNRFSNIKVLLDLFKSSGFVQYVSSIFLKNLVMAANTRFLKLTNNTLSLELDDKHNFIVRDFMNDGKTRLLKTLSGGQTFQASLCLALSLAENVKSLSQSDQSFFFLDEGFGSLDKQSLQTVFSTLKSLEKENRIVGVISHVEELKQEIGVSLDVVNDEEVGSQVKYSWE